MRLRLSQLAPLAALNDAGLPDVTPATERWFKNSIEQMIHSVGDIDAEELTPQQVYDWHQQTATRVTAVTANSYLRALKTVYNRLIARGCLPENPASGVRFAPEPPPRPRAVRCETYLALRDAARCQRDVAIVDALWATGCRIGELTTMSLETLEQWEQEDGTPAIAVEVLGKGRKRRYVYAGGTQAAAIKAWLRERPHSPSTALFINFNNLRPLQRPSLHSILRKLRIDAGLDQDTIANAHGFRHAFAIRMLDAGHDLATVSAWLGHSDPAFTAKVYVNRREDELRRKYFGR